MMGTGVIKDIVPGLDFWPIASITSLGSNAYITIAGNVVIHFLFVFELESIADRAVDNDIMMKQVSGFITEGVVIALCFDAP